MESPHNDNNITEGDSEHSHNGINVMERPVISLILVFFSPTEIINEFNLLPQPIMAGVGDVVVISWITEEHEHAQAKNSGT